MNQKNRIRILTLLFIVTGLGAAWISIGRSAFGGSGDESMKVSIDSASISKITIRNDSVTTVLTRNDLRWKVNNKYPARYNLTQLLITGLSHAEVKRPVAEENKAKVVALLKEKGIRVNVEGGEEPISFLIAANDNDANSSYYLAEGSSVPQVIFVPGFSGDMSNLFKMDEAGWRSRELFHSGPMSLQKISVSYPSQKANNIEITWKANQNFTISGVEKVDSTRLFTFLSQFEQINVDNYVYKDREKILSELSAKTPNAIIEVTDLDPSACHTLKVYGESSEPKGIYGIVDPEKELVVMKKETLFRILVKKEFFVKK